MSPDETPPPPRRPKCRGAARSPFARGRPRAHAPPFAGATTRLRKPPTRPSDSPTAPLADNASAAPSAGGMAGLRAWAPVVWPGHRHTLPPPPPRDALEGKWPQRRHQRRVGRRLEQVDKAVGGGYCRLQMLLRLALGVRGTVSGHRLGDFEDKSVEKGEPCCPTRVQKHCTVPSCVHGLMCMYTVSCITSIARALCLVLFLCGLGWLECCVLV